MSLLQLFRETKEGELRNLLKSRRELEGRLTRTVVGSLDEAETISRLDSSVGELSLATCFTNILILYMLNVCLTSPVTVSKCVIYLCKDL